MSACLVCQMATEEEMQNLTVLSNFLHDHEFQQIFLASEGLCVPHYRALVQRLKTTPQWVQKFQLQKYTELANQLGRYVESCNFSLGDQRPDLSREESLVWQKVVRMLFGYEGKPKL